MSKYQREDHHGVISIPGNVPSCRLSRRQRRIAMFVTIPLLGAAVGAATGVGVDAAVSASSAALMANLTHSASEYAIEATLSTEAHIAIGIAIGFAVLLLAVGIGFVVTQNKKKQKARSMHDHPRSFESKSSMFGKHIHTVSGRNRLVKISMANPQREKESKSSYHRRLKSLLRKEEQARQAAKKPKNVWCVR